MKLTKLIPNGYCYGVVEAVETVRKLILSDCPKPIHLYGMLIHNKHLIEAFEEKGVIHHFKPTEEEIDTMEGTIVFSAHGIKKSVIEKAKTQGLHIVNTVCRDVQSTIDLIDSYVDDGYEVLYVGKKDHPEAVASTERDGVHLITKIDDLTPYPKNRHYAMTNQTTLSSLELFDIYEAAKQRFSNIVIMEELCNATRMRQSAVINETEHDVLIVVGDKHSNNSKSLTKLHKNGFLVESYRDLFGKDFSNLSVALTAGASTPRAIINQVITYLEMCDGECREIELPELKVDDVLALK